MKYYDQLCHGCSQSGTRSTAPSAYLTECILCELVSSLLHRHSSCGLLTCIIGNENIHYCIANVSYSMQWCTYILTHACPYINGLYIYIPEYDHQNSPNLQNCRAISLSDGISEAVPHKSMNQKVTGVVSYMVSGNAWRVVLICKEKWCNEFLHYQFSQLLDWSVFSFPLIKVLQTIQASGFQCCC